MRDVLAAAVFGLVLAGPAAAIEPIPNRDTVAVTLPPAALRPGESRTYVIDTRAGAVATTPQISTRTLRVTVAEGPTGPFLRIALESYTPGPAYAATIEEVAAQAMVGLTAEVEINDRGRLRSVVNWEELRPGLAANLATLPASAARDQLSAWLPRGNAESAVAALLRDAAPISLVQSVEPLPPPGRRTEPEVRDRGRIQIAYTEALGIERSSCSIVLHRYVGSPPGTQPTERAGVGHSDTTAEISLGDGWVVRMQVTEEQATLQRTQTRTRLIARSSHIPACPGAGPVATP